jgi:NAD(P)-dependent dehydrogenase (short-subunit alcohol dehydrogenase family)
VARRAIITGSDSGIGKASAVALAGAGFDVGVTWFADQAGGEDTVRQVQGLGRRAVLEHLDVTEVPEAGDVIAHIADELGGLDVLVNNAGGSGRQSFLETSLEAWRGALDLNLTGAFVCAQRAARMMVESGTRGRIINITSVHEHIPLPNAAAYCVAKGGLGLLTKVMALELGLHGITVNAIAPGEIATPMTGAQDVDPAQLERPALPLQRPGSAHEIAAFVAFLASDEASYATGSSFVVDGGLMLTAAQFNARTAAP